MMEEFEGDGGVGDERGDENEGQDGEGGGVTQDGEDYDDDLAGIMTRRRRDIGAKKGGED